MSNVPTTFPFLCNWLNYDRERHKTYTMSNVPFLFFFMPSSRFFCSNFFFFFVLGPCVKHFFSFLTCCLSVELGFFLFFFHCLPCSRALCRTFFLLFFFHLSFCLWSWGFFSFHCSFFLMVGNLPWWQRTQFSALMAETQLSASIVQSQILNCLVGPQLLQTMVGTQLNLF